MKLLSKVLANRLKPKIPQLIDPDQTGFIHGRNIAENIVYAPRPGQYRWRPEGRRHREKTLKERLRYIPDSALAIDFITAAPSFYTDEMENSAAVTNVNAVASYLNNIEPLNGANFPDWKGKVMTCLAWNDLDLALREDKPNNPAAGQTSAALEKWERSDRMATMVMRQTISAGIKGTIPTNDAQGADLSAKALLEKIEENFKSSSKTYASILIMKLVASQYNGQVGIREHILSMCDMANRLKEMQMEISEKFLAHFIITSLPSSQYAPFKINYNTNKATWSMSELISYCVEKEERLKTEKMKDVMNMVQNLNINGTPKNQHESGSSKQGQMKNKKVWNKKIALNNNNNNKFKKKSKFSNGKKVCSFCVSPKHLQIDCAGFKKWLKTKSIPYDPNYKKRGAKPKSG
ncbi:unnamed protein product [Urochloa humidicola]